MINLFESVNEEQVKEKKIIESNLIKLENMKVKEKV